MSPEETVNDPFKTTETESETETTETETETEPVAEKSLHERVASLEERVTALEGNTGTSGKRRR